MKISLRGMIAWILLLCTMLGILMPAASAEAGDSVVFDFYNDYRTGYDKLYHYQVNSAGEAENDIAADYAAGRSNWKIETFAGYANYSTGYITAFASPNSYVVVRFKVPATGNYSVALNYVATNNTVANSSAPADYSELYIFPAEQESYTQADILNLAERSQPLSTISYYYKLYASRSEKMEYSFETGKEYLFAIKVGDNASNLGTSQAYLKSLTLNWIGAYNAPASQGKQPLPIVVKEQVTNVWKDGVFSAITQVNGRDYLAIPVYGGKMFVCDLDLYQVIAEIDTGISTPRGATVDSQGNIWVSGPESFLFKYNPYTHEGTRTKNYTGAETSISAGSAFAITEGDDGCLYFGTYSNAQIVKYDPVAEKFTKIEYKESGFKYATAVLKKGNYIYSSLHKEGDDGVQQHYLLKMDANTYETVAMLDIASIMGTQRYLQGLQWLDDTRIIGSGTGKMFVVDVEKMRIVTPEEFGTDGSLKGNISEVRNNKVYFTTSEYGLYEYDLTTRKATYVMGNGGILGMQCNVNNFVTLNVKDGQVVPKSAGGEEKEYLIAFAVSNIVISAMDPIGKTSVSLKNLLDPNAGESVSIRALENGLPGSNEILTGSFQSNLTYAYNTETGSVSTYTGAGMQTDAIHIFNNKLYVGNYTLGQLTEINPTTKKPKALITLNDNTFDQSRIHTITSGDNKVFVGTIPDVYEHGGMIAWYDFSKNRAYAAVGPNPEDVYWSTNNSTWYNEVTGALRVEDTSDDAVPGVIKDQSIICLTYHNGLLYGTSSTQGGTAAKGVAGPSVLFVYDVSQRQVVATSTLSEIGATNVRYVAGVAADPNVATNGKFWGVVAETLFSFTYNPGTRTFDFKTELSFDKKVNSSDGGRFLAPRHFRFYEGYLYVTFGARGNLCKINLEDPRDYQMLLPVTEKLSDIPTDYLIAEDGNFYFLGSTGIYMLNIDPTEEEWEKAQVVDNLIAGLQPISVEKVNAVNAAYNALTNREKSLVQTMDVFRNAEAEYLIQRINAMAENPGCTAVHIQQLRTAFNNLPSLYKGQITNIHKLIAAEVNLLYAEKEEKIVLVTNAAGESFYYGDLQTAMAFAKDAGTTVTLLENVKMDGFPVVEHGVTLDLNGKILNANGLVVLEGMICDGVGTGLLQVQKDTLLISSAKQTSIAIWDGENSGYRFSNVTFQTLTKQASNGIAQYIFLPTFSNSAAASLLADGGSDNGLKIQVCLTWNNGKSQQFYTYSDALVQKVFDGTNRWVFDLKVTGIDNMEEMVASAMVVSDCGSQAVSNGSDLIPVFPKVLECEQGFMELI